MNTLLTLLLALCVTQSALSQTTNALGQVLKPANKTFEIEWDYEPEEPNFSFKLWDSTNLLASLTTNQFRVVGTNGAKFTYVAALTNGLPKGTNNLSMTTVGVIAGEGTTKSPTAPIRLLGEPSPPSAPRTR